MTTIPTIAQANKILTFAKFILGGMGFLIAGTFGATVYGVNFTNNTKHNFETLSMGQAATNSKVDKVIEKVDTYHIDDVQYKQATDDRLKALEDNKQPRYSRPITYQTQTYDPVTKVRRMNR
jgi:hypothetical protein